MTHRLFAGTCSPRPGVLLIFKMKLTCSSLVTAEIYGLACGMTLSVMLLKGFQACACIRIQTNLTQILDCVQLGVGIALKPCTLRQ